MYTGKGKFDQKLSTPPHCRILQFIKTNEIFQ